MQDFKTTDIGLAAAITAADFKISRIESDGVKGTFYFDKTDELLKAVNEYWDGSLFVNARKMFENIKIIKGRVRSSL